jgi:hypothetical protein
MTKEIAPTERLDKMTFIFFSINYEIFETYK